MPVLSYSFAIKELQAMGFEMSDHKFQNMVTMKATF